MYKKNVYKILSNTQLTPRTWKMMLEGDTSFLTAPGQFVNVAVEGHFLRRPISVCDFDAHSITLLYDVAGEGTRWMSDRLAGEKLDLLTGLGNGFDVNAPGEVMALLGGGIGVAPLLRLAKDLIANGKKPVAVLGFNKAEDVVLEKDFLAIGVPVYVSTVDGSYGTKGFVTDAMLENNVHPDYFYACGPLPMLRSLCSLETPGELSLDERMACGFGVCMCCSLETVDGPKRICKEGPVFRKEVLIWK